MHNNSILKDNEALRVQPPVWVLALWGSYAVWQMGIVYFGSTTLSLDGRTPLPFDPQYIVFVMVLGYIASIVFTLFFQQYSVWAVRTSMPFSLLLTLLMFMPLSESAFCAFYYAQVFLCVFMIGATMSVPINFFTLHSEALDGGITLVVSGVVIAVLQNDFFSISFTAFNVMSVVVHAAIIISSFIIKPKSEIRFATFSQSPKRPKKLTVGLYLVIALSALMTCFGTSCAESVKHGVSVLYISAAVGGALFLVFSGQRGLNPVKLCTVFLSLSAAGFLMFALSVEFPAIRLLSCFLLGLGVTVCNLSAFFGIYIFSYSASRLVVPCIVLAGLVTASFHSLLLSALRDNLPALYLICAVLSVLPLLAYMNISQSLAFEWDRLRQKDENKKKPPKDAVALFPELSGQENRLAELILQGYSGQEIADIMNITLGTMKNYRVNMYQKLFIHSRRELFELAEKKGSPNEAV